MQIIGKDHSSSRYQTSQRTCATTNVLLYYLLLLRPRSERPSAAELMTDPFVVDQQQ